MISLNQVSHKQIFQELAKISSKFDSTQALQLNRSGAERRCIKECHPSQKLCKSDDVLAIQQESTKLSSELNKIKTCF